jgi:hypothetical protein
MVKGACAHAARQAKVEGLFAVPHLEYGGADAAEQGLATAPLRADFPH